MFLQSPSVFTSQAAKLILGSADVERISLPSDFSCFCFFSPPSAGCRRFGSSDCETPAFCVCSHIRLFRSGCEPAGPLERNEIDFGGQMSAALGLRVPQVVGLNSGIHDLIVTKN